MELLDATWVCRPFTLSPVRTIIMKFGPSKNLSLPFISFHREETTKIHAMLAAHSSATETAILIGSVPSRRMRQVYREKRNQPQTSQQHATLFFAQMSQNVSFCLTPPRLTFLFLKKRRLGASHYHLNPAVSHSPISQWGYPNIAG